MNDSTNMENITSHNSSGRNDLLERLEGDYWPIRDPLYIVIPITIIYLVIFVTGLVGNVITCLVIVRSKYLHTSTNIYLFSLAISDLLLLLSGLPAEMHSIWRRYPDVFGQVFCVGRGLASETSANATVLTITAFTVERYLAICKPFMTQKWQHKLNRVIRQIIIIWMLSIGLAIPQALQFGLVEGVIGPNKTAEICTVKKVIIEHSFEIATFLFFVAPMILITVLYCFIGFTLRKANRVKEGRVHLRKSTSGSKREPGQQRVIKMLVAVVVAFFVCWAPFHAQRLIAIWGVRFLESSKAMQTTYHVMTYISGILYYASTCDLMSIKCCGRRMKRKQNETKFRAPQSLSQSRSSRSQSHYAVKTEETAFNGFEIIDDDYVEDELSSL